MDKVLSARVDQSIVSRIGMLARQTHMSKKKIIERSIQMYAASVVLLMALVMCGSVWAATNYVTPTGAGGYNGSDWDNAFSNIQAAVDACLGEPSTIYIRYGVYSNAASITMHNAVDLTIRGGYAGNDVGGLPGEATNAPTIVTRMPSVNIRIFFATNATFTLDRLTVTNGNLNNTTYFGNGILLVNCQATVTNCSIVGNSGKASGLGISARTSGSLGIFNSDISGNLGAFSSKLGGGIYTDGSVALTMKATTISNNHAYANSHNYGGGVCLIGGTALLDDCSIIANRVTAWTSFSGYGGGLYAINVGSLIITNCVFSGNYANGSGVQDDPHYGAAMYLAGAGTNLISDSIITSNCLLGFAKEDICLTGTGPTTIRNTVMNRGGWRGIYKLNSGALTVNNCLIHSFGSNGIHLVTGTVDIVNCTLAGNTGWGVTNSPAALTVRNSIAWTNTLGGISTNAGDVVTYTCSQELHPGTGNKSVDPLFVDAAADDYHLTNGSPCIEAGINEAWMANALDLDGTNRIRGKTVDMGCYEGEPPPPSGTTFMVM